MSLLHAAPQFSGIRTEISLPMIGEAWGGGAEYKRGTDPNGYC